MSGTTFAEYLRRRELGLKQQPGFRDASRIKIYCNLQPFDSFTASAETGPDHGAVFNLEFSRDGRKLVAACEKKTLLVLDSVSRRLVHANNSAHSDCVNGITFLDDKLFLSCSDDTTVALWDLRKMCSPVRRLKGHNRWVKNIEAMPYTGLVLTSGFDSRVICWDINSLTEDSCASSTMLRANDLMRMKISPDGSKLVISTSSGYMLVVHDLDLLHLKDDLTLFKPSIYRLMQETLIMIPEMAKYTKRFKKSCTRNRLELIADFPRGDTATMISSLEIHPNNWCTLSRNTSNNQDSEWTCLHDLQQLPNKNQCNDDEDLEFTRNEVFSREIIEAELAGVTTNTVESSQTDLRIHKNKRRLLYYCEESNVGQGFIKEQAFSPDGRLISSPFGFGVRLLAFSPECHDPWDLATVGQVSSGVKCLYEVRTNICHGNVVACTKFSPTEPLLVSGCINGKIAWHQMRL